MLLGPQWKLSFAVQSCQSGQVALPVIPSIPAFAYSEHEMFAMQPVPLDEVLQPIMLQGEVVHLLQPQVSLLDGPVI